jgi:hypothetical protein
VVVWVVTVLVLVVVVAVVVVEVVVVGGGGWVVVEVTVDAVVVDEDVLVVPPLSAATTASATPRPITTATSTAIAHFTPRLIPSGGGSEPGGEPASCGWPMCWVGSSCISGRV